MHLRHRIFITLLASLSALGASAQLTSPGSGTPTNGLGATPGIREYTIGGVKTVGTQFIDEDLLVTASGLTRGDKLRLPYDEKLSRAIRNLWRQDLFANVRVDVDRVVGDEVFLTIVVEEQPRLSKYNFKGIKKSEGTELKDKVALSQGKVVTEATKREAIERIKKYFVDKGYGQVSVTSSQRPDSSRTNSVILTFDINKGGKTHINQINISGAEATTEARLKRTFKGTKEMSRITLHPTDDEGAYDAQPRSFRKYLRNYGFLSPTKTLDALDPYFRFKLFASSKFNQQKYEDDKESLVAYYNSLGFRDAQVADDTIYAVKSGDLNIDMRVAEGRRYYFGDFTWRGNTKYTTEQLSRILNIKRGDVYNASLLDSRIGRQLSADGSQDISSLYMDDGYLFFNIEPVETSIVGDTINYELRVTEGSQATIGKVNIYGNDRTNEHVIRRELYTRPGNKFSRQDIIRSQREIANLGFFDQEHIGIQPKPHPETGTVDIDYTLVEKSSDQLQLSAGFGGGVKFYGNVGIVFNNFSIRNIFRPKFWDPLPIGDGQKFSINYQSNGIYYNSLTTSFTEPWLGGKKPTALTTAIQYNRLSQSGADGQPANHYLRALGGSVSISKRLKVPDDFFVLTYGLNYTNYHLNDYQGLTQSFTNGRSNNLYARLVLARYSVDQPLYPRSGSNISLTMQFTPPYSAISGKDYTDAANANEKFKWVEYHKYRFTADWYQTITGNLVFKLSTKAGFLGYYNPDIGFSPFERFQVGGDGLQGQNFFIGRDIISQRGYETYSSADGATIFNKYTAEIRYPFSLSPTSTIYGLAFVDAANAWDNFKDYNPFKLRRDAGLGVRLYLPMFGLLGLDYGVGFDRIDKNAGITRFKDISRFTFMLGFEPD